MKLRIACIVLLFCLAASFRVFPKHNLQVFQNIRLRGTDTIEQPAAEESVITLTDQARSHLRTLKEDSPSLYLRMGVKSGGCSGMSYAMDVVDPSTVSEDDYIEKFGDIYCVIDPKSLLYLYGLRLDYSNELIGGGFKFSNPNAETSW
ncbi:iron-sulfur cluster assembly accessory protein [archaeon]|nr:MAG: iron-sulfur cluster assembly accessory protein [archaeon]